MNGLGGPATSNAGSGAGGIGAMSTAHHHHELPMYDILQPTDTDVLSGRGVTTNRHDGNTSFRALVSLNKELYVTSTKKEKMRISRSIVDAVRSRHGRFLEKNPITGLWNDIGDRKAIEKTSQALRDGAASLRKQLSADLGDPDFINAVFETDGQVEDQQKEKSKDKSNGGAGGKPKTLPKKSHRRTKSNPDSVKEAIKQQKNLFRKLKSMDIPPSPRGASGVSNTIKVCITSPPRIHSQPVSPTSYPSRPNVQSSSSFDNGPYEGHYHGSGHYPYLHPGNPSGSFDESWHGGEPRHHEGYGAPPPQHHPHYHHHPLSSPRLWHPHQHHRPTHYANPRRYGAGQPPMGETPPHSPAPSHHYHGRHHVHHLGHGHFEPRGNGAYVFTRSPPPIHRSYSSGPGYGYHGPPHHPGYGSPLYSDPGLTVPALDCTASHSSHGSNTSHHGHVTASEPGVDSSQHGGGGGGGGAPMSPYNAVSQRTPYYHGSHSMPKDFLPPISPSSSRGPREPPAERVISELAYPDPDDRPDDEVDQDDDDHDGEEPDDEDEYENAGAAAYKAVSPTMVSTNSSYKENSTDHSPNVVQVKMEGNGKSPQVVVSSVSMDEVRSSSPNRPEVEIVLGGNQNAYDDDDLEVDDGPLDRIDREWPGLAAAWSSHHHRQHQDHGSEHKSEYDPSLGHGMDIDDDSLPGQGLLGNAADSTGSMSPLQFDKTDDAANELMMELVTDDLLHMPTIGVCGPHDDGSTDGMINGVVSRKRGGGGGGGGSDAIKSEQTAEKA